MKIEGDAEVNPPGVKETCKTIEIPPNIATRLNTRGPILFKCCRVVFNKETNRLELSAQEVVGKDFLRCNEDEEDDENDNGKIIYIHIYIYTRFQKGFHIERYIDRYILLFSCTCALEHFSLLIVQLVKKLGSTMNFVFVRFLVLISQKKKNAQILSAILLFCMLLKIKECGIRSVVGHIIVVVTG